MESKFNKIDEVTQEVEFEVPYSELSNYFEKAYKKFQKKAEIPGFRKGKAPINILKLKYGDLIEQSSLEDIANEIFRNYLMENDIKPVSEGQLIDIDYEPKGHLQFKVKYEVFPEIKLTKYKGIEITKTLRKVGDKEIEDEIRHLQYQNAGYEDKDKVDGREFLITVDLQELDENGIEIIGKKHKNINFYLNSPELSEDIVKQFEDISKGEERVIYIPSENGKIKKYRAFCNKIQKVNLPELNEDFFGKIYGENAPKTSEEFKNKIKEDLDAFYKNLEERELKNNIISELIRINDVSVPNSITDKILDSYLEEIISRNPRRGLPEQFDEEEYRKTKRADAILEAKWYLIRDKIIELEKIEVNDEDLRQIIEEDSKMLNIPEDKLEKLYKENYEVKQKILDRKLIKFLKENSIIREIENTDHSLTS